MKKLLITLLCAALLVLPAAAKEILAPVIDDASADAAVTAALTRQLTELYQRTKVRTVVIHAVGADLEEAAEDLLDAQPDEDHCIAVAYDFKAREAEVEAGDRVEELLPKSARDGIARAFTSDRGKGLEETLELGCHQVIAQIYKQGGFDTADVSEELAGILKKQGVTGLSGWAYLAGAGGGLAVILVIRALRRAKRKKETGSAKPQPRPAKRR